MCLDFEGRLMGKGVEGVVNVCLSWFSTAWKCFGYCILHETEVSVKVYRWAIFNVDEVAKGGSDVG